jgi:hypothetical protein
MNLVSPAMYPKVLRKYMKCRRFARKYLLDNFLADGAGTSEYKNSLPFDLSRDVVLVRSDVRRK